jgi:hypothetical protein
MRSMFIRILTGVGLLLIVSSCATVPDEPLAPGQLRLTGVRFPDVGGVKTNLKYVVNLKFEADGRPEITRVCVYWSVYGPSCEDPMEVNYGNGTLSSFVRTPLKGQYSFKAYVYYLRNGVSLRSNMVEIPMDVTP